MSQSARQPLFGREHELVVLTRVLHGALRGGGRLVWISGEPGIGKTRLAEEVATCAACRGAAVVWARSVADAGAPAFWPWTECVRVIVREASLRGLALPRSAVERLTTLAPELAPSAARARCSVAPGDATARYHLFDAVRTVLERATARVPHVIVFDDLHLADASSLLLLEFVARALAGWRLLLLATSRDDEQSPEVVKTLGELAREGLKHVALSGLALEDTARVLAHVTGAAWPEDLVRQVHSRTSGNPFFVSELAELGQSSQGAIPENVRAVVRQRVGRLSALAQQFLLTAAVMGVEFELSTVAGVMFDEGVSRLLGALDEALAHVFVQPVPDGAADQYRFRHALVREALYESASPSRRAQLHAAIVEQWEQQLGTRADVRATELAHHACRAEALVGARRAAKYSRLAGERMLAAHAFEEALPHFERAWSARQRAPDADDAEILAGLGLAQAATTVRWNREQAWRNLRAAVELYVGRGEVARAVALVTHPALAAEGVSDVVTVIRRLLLPLVPAGSAEHGALLARAAAALYFDTGADRPIEPWIAQALSIAASRQDAALELRVLALATCVDHFALRWGEALEHSRRALALATRVEELHAATYAGYRAAFVLIHTGRTAEASRIVHSTLATAERLRDRGLLADALYAAVLLAQLRGQSAAAREHSDRGLALSPRHLPLLHARSVLEYEGGQAAVGRTYVERLLEADRESQPYPLAGVFTAIALAQVGYLTREVDARCVAVAARAVSDRAHATRNAVVSAQMARSLVAVLESDVEACEAELEVLEPLATTMPMQWGLATSRLLGLLAHTAGQLRRACTHFEAALSFCRTSGFAPELAWTCYDYAALLLGRGDRDDRVRAATLLEEGAVMAAALGLSPLRLRIDRFRERYGLWLARTPAGLTSRELDVLRLLAVGKANKEIADALCISVHTVAVHVSRVLEKTGTSNRTEAAAYAARHHLLEPTRPGDLLRRSHGR